MMSDVNYIIVRSFAQNIFFFNLINLYGLVQKFLSICFIRMRLKIAGKLNEINGIK